MEEYEIRCGEIKDKLKRLETNVESYNNPSTRIKTSKEESPIGTKMFPLCFKERQSERKMSGKHYDTSFARDKNTAVVPNYNTNTSIKFISSQNSTTGKAS